MLACFAKSSIGFSHINNKKPCQDYSCLYKDNNRIIISCCDGHGGDVYIRSNVGSNIASNTVMNVFASLTPAFFTRLKEEDIENNIKLSILCEWNKMIEQHLSYRPFKKSEFTSLDEEQIENIKLNPAKAYGTTLTGALLINNKLVVVAIGDSEAIIINKGKVEKVFDNEDDPAGNVTYSMCQEDAFKYIRVKVINFKDIDGILLCTDGLSNPYQSYDNFNKSFIKPLLYKIIKDEGTNYIDSFIDELASKLGFGDDVSLSFIINDSAKIKYYR